MSILLTIFLSVIAGLITELIIVKYKSSQEKTKRQKAKQNSSQPAYSLSDEEEAEIEEILDDFLLVPGRLAFIGICFLALGILVGLIGVLLEEFWLIYPGTFTLVGGIFAMIWIGFTLASFIVLFFKK